MTPLHILTIPGSLRSISSTHAVLDACEAILAPGATVTRLGNIAVLPHFDDRPDIPAEVQTLRATIEAADAVLFCTPEYAFGIPGALKNMPDWTVATTVWADKPVAVITAATGGEHAHHALLLTLTALGTARAADRNLLISFIRTKMAGERLSDASTLAQINRVCAALLAAPGLR